MLIIQLYQLMEYHGIELSNKMSIKLDYIYSWLYENKLILSI